MSHRQGRERGGASRGRGRGQGRQQDDNNRPSQPYAQGGASSGTQSAQGQYPPQQQQLRYLPGPDGQPPPPAPSSRPASAQPPGHHPPPPPQRPSSSPGTTLYGQSPAPLIPRASAAASAGAWAAGPPTSRNIPPIPRPASASAIGASSTRQQPGLEAGSGQTPGTAGGSFAARAGSPGMAWGIGPGNQAGGGSSSSAAGGRSLGRGLGPGGGGRGRGGRPPQPQQRGYQDLQVAPIAEAQRSMVHLLQAGSARTFKQDPPQEPDIMPAIRPPVGVLGSPVSLLVNLYLLQLTGRQLLHYDVMFERVRASSAAGAAGATRGGRAGPSQGATRGGRSGGRGSAPGPIRPPQPAAASSTTPSAVAATPATAAARNPKPPENAREIMLEFERQYWSDPQQPAVVYAYDGAKSLVTPSVPPHLSGEMNVPSTFVVQDVKTPGQDRATSWQLTFKLTRPPIGLDTMRQIAQQLATTATAGDRNGLTDLLNLYQDQRQLLEWVLRNVLLSRTGGQGGVAAALGMVNEVGRTLYFVRNRANRNIGGGLCALAGLQTGVKLTQSGVMFAADITTSAFLRTDISLVEWMTEVAGLAAPGRGGPSGAQRLVEQYRRDRRLQLKIARALKNRKVLYHGPNGRVCKYVATGLSAEPADCAYFEHKPKDGSEAGVQRITVAQYYAQMSAPLLYPQLPVVVMKLPKNCKMDKIWVPPELLKFCKNQRVQIITHKGGTEQMIDAARKDPEVLKQDIQGALNPLGSDAPSRPSKRLESGFGVLLQSDMARVAGRVLPGPWLSYKAPGGAVTAVNTGRKGSWNAHAFTEPASLDSWGLLAVLPQQSFDLDGPTGLRSWVWDLIQRMVDFGITVGSMQATFDGLMRNVIWVPESATMLQVQAHLQDARDRAEQASRRPCRLVVCFIRERPSPVYWDIKVAAELLSTEDLQRRGGQTLGLMTQVVVAARTDLGGFARHQANRRSQYQANLCMKINAKLGGVNTKWALEVGQLLRSYFKLQHQAPSLMVFGIDLTHPGRVEGGRSIAAVVGSLDKDLCRYGHQVWQEPATQAGNEAVSEHLLITAVQQLLVQHLSHTSCKPGCLIIYRDGVSDAELESVRQLEVGGFLEACSQLEEGYRPRVVYLVVQKRHNVRFFTADGSNKGNVAPGTVVDHTIVSPWLFDFYLNSHAAIIGTSKAARYICLLDELGFGSDGLQTFTNWLCYLYCRCARAVSIVAPVYYAHLLAFRARRLSDDVSEDSASLRSGSSGSSSVPRFGQYAPQLDSKMFFV